MNHEQIMTVHLTDPRPAVEGSYRVGFEDEDYLGLHVTFPVNDELQRTRRDAGGNTLIEVKGPARIRFTPASAKLHSITRDASGPSLGTLRQVAYRNGDFLFSGTGNQWTDFENRSELAGTGLPLAFVSRGDFRILFKADRRGNFTRPADVITRPSRVWNICRLMSTQR